MEGMTLLQEARTVGLIVTAEGNTLKISGPKRAQATARQLIDSKIDVLAALRADAIIAPIQAIDSDMAAGLRYQWSERMAICQFEGGLTYPSAERIAIDELKQTIDKMAITPSIYRKE